VIITRLNINQDKRDI